MLRNKSFWKLSCILLNKWTLKSFLWIWGWSGWSFGSCFLYLNRSSCWSIIHLPHVIVEVSFIHLVVITNLSSWTFNHTMVDQVLICGLTRNIALCYPIFQQVSILWLLHILKTLRWCPLFLLDHSGTAWILGINCWRSSIIYWTILLWEILCMRFHNFRGRTYQNIFILLQWMLAQPALNRFILVQARLSDNVWWSWYWCVRKCKRSFPTCRSFGGDLLFWCEWGLGHLENGHLFF